MAPSRATPGSELLRKRERERDGGREGEGEVGEEGRELERGERAGVLLEYAAIRRWSVHPVNSYDSISGE